MMDLEEISDELSVFFKIKFFIELFNCEKFSIITTRAIAATITDEIKNVLVKRIEVFSYIPRNTIIHRPHL